jgi:peptidylprolyl isomerase
MRLATALALAALPLAAQTFDTRMPDSVPVVAGKVMEGATLRYIDVQVGDGAPAAAAQQYTVHYTGWLRDGTKFDSSIGKEPIQFVQGRRQVISGWEMGFEGMKVGGRRRLFIPYQMAYGEQGRDSIPPKAELVFDVELLKVEPAPDAPPAAGDVLFSLNSVEIEVMQLAKAVPEEKYSWRPAPGVRTFQQVFLHIAYANHLILNIAKGSDEAEVKKIIEDNDKGEQQPISKQKTLAALTSSYAEVHKYLDEVRAQALTRDAEFFGQKTTRRGVLIFLDTHMGEHLGQAIAYARMNGIVPPWSK